MYSDPSGQHLRRSAQKRQSGAYNLYHNLNGYVFTNVTNGDELEVRYRMRNNPGFKLVAEAFTGENRIGETHHVKIIRKDNRFEYLVDNQKILDIADDLSYPIHERGLMGFRTWHTSVWIDNMIIKKS